MMSTNNLIEKIIQPWDGSSWLTGSINSYTYDENNNQIESLCQNLEWFCLDESLERWYYAYDGNNNCD